MSSETLTAATSALASSFTLTSLPPPPSSPPHTPSVVAHLLTSLPHSVSPSRPTSSPLTAGLSCPLTHALIEQSVLHSLIQQHTRALLPAVLSHSSVVCAAKERVAVCAADVSDDRQVVRVMCGELCERLSVGGQRLQEARERWQRQQRPRQKVKAARRTDRSQ